MWGYTTIIMFKALTPDKDCNNNSVAVAPVQIHLTNPEIAVDLVPLSDRSSILNSNLNPEALDFNCFSSKTLSLHVLQGPAKSKGHPRNSMCLSKLPSTSTSSLPNLFKKASLKKSRASLVDSQMPRKTSAPQKLSRSSSSPPIMNSPKKSVSGNNNSSSPSGVSSFPTALVSWDPMTSKETGILAPRGQIIL